MKKKKSLKVKSWAEGYVQFIIIFKLIVILDYKSFLI